MVHTARQPDPPLVQPPAWSYPRDPHEVPQDHAPPPISPVSPSAPTNMSEPSPIAEHPSEYDAHPGPDAVPVPVPAPRQNYSPPPVPAIQVLHTDADVSPAPVVSSPSPRVPATIRISSPPATPSVPAPPPVPAQTPPILAPSPAFARSPIPIPMPIPVHAPTPGPTRLPGPSSSEDSRVDEDLSILQRPARPRHAPHRAQSTNGFAAPREPIAYPSRMNSYSAPRHQHGSLRLSRPASAGLLNGVAGELSRDPYLSRGLDYIVPAADGKRDSGAAWSFSSGREKPLGERLLPTLIHAREQLMAAKRKAKYSSYALNVCIGLQVVLGAITTGVAAASTTSRSSTSVGIPILGGLSTLAASYLARARGSGEPEQSIVRAHDLEHFIRDAEAFLLDRGHLVGMQYDAEVRRYRMRFEEIMGHIPGKNGAPAKDAHAAAAVAGAGTGQDAGGEAGHEAFHGDARQMDEKIPLKV